MPPAEASLAARSSLTEAFPHWYTLARHPVPTARAHWRDRPLAHLLSVLFARTSVGIHESAPARSARVSLAPSSSDIVNRRPSMTWMPRVRLAVSSYLPALVLLSFAPGAARASASAPV